MTVRHTDAAGNWQGSDPVKVIVREPLVPSLVWTSPLPGSVVETPGVVPLVVTATDPLGEIRRVEFHDGNALLGVSEILTKDAIIPGRPRVHTWPWTNPPAGFRYIIASAVSAGGTRLAISRNLEVREALGAPYVTVRADKASASETGDSKSRALVFRFTRTGETSHGLTVFYGLGGTATFGIDYMRSSDAIVLPADPTQLATFVIPAGQSEASETFYALADALKEGPESVEVRLKPSPNAGPRPTYQIGDPAVARGEIADATPPPHPATIVWRQPVGGQHLAFGTPIPFVVVARDPAGLLFHVDFFAGELKIGSSDWTCPVCKPAPGAELVHEFAWKDATPGLHTLRAESVDASGARVVSAPVTIAVDPPVPPIALAIRHLPGSFAANTPFTVAIDVTPAPGTQAWG